jgi:hypothetical protein
VRDRTGDLIRKEHRGLGLQGYSPVLLG